MKQVAEKRDRVVIWLLGGLLFRTICALFLFPGFDEAYYYLYARNLAWSYFDHPLIVALTTRLGLSLMGSISQFTIRIGALLLYTASLYLFYKLAVRLFSVRAGLIALAIATVTPLFNISFGILTSPENGLIFFWTASLYCAVAEFFPPSRRLATGASAEAQRHYKSYQPSYRLAILGVLLGLTCLSKYHGFVLALGILGFLLTSPRHRAGLRSPWMVTALGAFLITLFPLWFWNAQYDWISFRFQLFMRFSGGGSAFNPLNAVLGLLGTWAMGVGYLFPTVALPLWWVTLKSLNQQRDRFSRRSFSTEESLWFDQQALILWTSLPVMLGFTLLGGVTQILPAWPAPGFWGMTLLLAHHTSLWQRRARRRIRRWIGGTGAVVAGLLLFALLHISTGTLQKPGQYALFGGFVPPQADPSRELINIAELRQRFRDTPALAEALASATFVFTNEYYLGGYIDMALRPLTDIPITAFTGDPRGFAFWTPAQQAWLGGNALYITLERFAEQPEISNRFTSYFERLELVGTAPIRRGGEPTEIFYVFLAEGFKQPYDYPYGVGS
ncbi:MAG: glycosyltransferase family 39 protein [Cyanobacteria bacterium P01_D01_bin.128]